MSVHSVSPPLDTSHSYAWWAGRLSAVLSTLVRDPHDEVHRARARRMLYEFSRECKHREQLIEEIVPQSIRAELQEVVERPEKFFSLEDRP